MDAAKISSQRPSVHQSIPEDAILHSHRRENLKSYMTQEVGTRKHSQVQMWTEYEGTANQQGYLEMLTRLRETLQRMRPEFGTEKRILHHGNAAEHNVLSSREFFIKNFVTKMNHLSLYTLISLLRFWIFPKLKNALKKEMFSNSLNIQCNVTKLLRGIPRNDFR
jgi:hypothetical protein